MNWEEERVHTMEFPVSLGDSGVFAWISARKAKTLFATHYQANWMRWKILIGVKNYNVSVKEVDQKVIFLRKLVRGGSETVWYSCGKMAGCLKSILSNGLPRYCQMEQSSSNGEEINKNWSGCSKEKAFKFFSKDDPKLCWYKLEMKLKCWCETIWPHWGT